MKSISIPVLKPRNALQSARCSAKGNNGGAQMPTRDRVQNSRAKLREAGLKPIRIWVPDPATPGFAAECLRQSHLALQDPQNLHDLNEMVEIADWGEE